MNDTNELGREGIVKLLFRFSIPSVIGMVVNALYVVVDRVFVGRGVGPLALSGVGITLPLTNIIMAAGMLIGGGGGALVSLKLGQKRKKSAEKIVGNSIILTIIISLFVTVVCLLFQEPILRVLGASNDTMIYAKQFSTILILGTVLQNVGFGMNPIIRAQGDPKMAMKMMLTASVLNCIINPLLIFVVKLGVRGSALATITSQTMCSLWVLFYFTKGKSNLKLRKENLKLDSRIVKEILSIGMSPCAMQIAASMVTIILNTSLNKYGGDLGVASFALINSIAILFVMPLLGVNQGAQPIIGYNYGAKNIKRVKKTIFYACGVNLIIAIMGFAIVHISPTNIVEIFNTNDPALIKMASNGLSLFLMMFGFVGLQASITNYYQAVGKPKHSMFLSLSRQILILIPLVLILPRFLKLNGVWIAGAASDLLSTILAVIFFVFEIKRLNKIDKNKEDYEII
ncbi:MAG: MATE family efflux transporter [Clostridium sp.]|nr:MATE family efflux transporter [Clostridium sp.]